MANPAHCWWEFDSFVVPRPQKNKNKNEKKGKKGEEQAITDRMANTTQHTSNWRERIIHSERSQAIYTSS